jgi:hypothetical protein
VGDIYGLPLPPYILAAFHIALIWCILRPRYLLLPRPCAPDVTVYRGHTPFATFLPATRLCRCVECKVCHCSSAVLALGSALPTHPPERLLPSQAATTTATLTRPRPEPPQHQMIASATHSSPCRHVVDCRSSEPQIHALALAGAVITIAGTGAPVQPTASTHCMPSFATWKPSHATRNRRSRTRIISSSASLTLFEVAHTA